MPRDESRDPAATEARIEVAPRVEPSHRPRYALLVMSERTTSSLFTLPEEGEVTLGRSDACTLRIDDGLLSRKHAAVRRAGESFEIVDLGSMNGSFVGEERLAPNVPRALAIGDTIRIGATNLVLQYASGGARPRRLWAHGYFEARLEDECARAEQGGRGFAIARVRVDAGTQGTIVERVLVEVLRPIDVIATYADAEYEMLLVETSAHAAEAIAKDIEHRLASERVKSEIAVACYPRDGRTPESLVARAGKAMEPQSLAPSAGAVRTGALARMDALVDKVAASAISVLLLGETGVGKEVLARTIHDRSPRAKKPLVCLNCASLSESLLESELFGHEKGAFTGAVGAKIGLLESAAGGTAFLDEVGEMPLSLQAKLLRVIEQREVLRVGALTPRPIDVRFLAATNRDLEQEIARGRFREDLYYRLNGFSLVIPPLRQRTDEIESLARHFMRAACEQLNRRPLDLSPEALALMLEYEWPGNVRELKNVVDRAVLLCSGSRIMPDHLPREKMGRILAAKEAPAIRYRTAPPSAFTDAEITISRVGSPTLPPMAAQMPRAAEPAEDDERGRIISALEQCAGNQTQAAKILGISRQTLVTRIETYNLPRPRKRA